MNQAISSWMSAEGPDSDIVLSSRIRLARNIDQYKFPTLFSNEEAQEIIQLIKNRMEDHSFAKIGRHGFINHG